ncbi:acyl carrier protein [Eggerthellaceae bacterium zg-1084]|uniref:Acyl carrier protein n=1 Tax=Berryella wangjianweii TaxID=2734634 RepID=A0A6M8J1A2_9ACTN|nr:acyl carrier protein [Berryella wangjianweii]NPD31342.1 acyl carrier protein [Berryella wangjianweii]NPD32349.1 acyl carrier protein [Eggerthellaceae bacterium zg-997]QKF06881.1 acyl carrier protein [Berryella wangjianweii]
MATIDVIRQALADNLDIDPTTVTPEATLDSLAVDSLDMVELICDVEERLNIELGEPEGLVTVGDMVAYIDAL